MTDVQRIDALIRRFWHLRDTSELSEEAWVKLYAEYRVLRKSELEEMEIAMYNATAKVAQQLFGKNE